MSSSSTFAQIRNPSLHLHQAFTAVVNSHVITWTKPKATALHNHQRRSTILVPGPPLKQPPTTINHGSCHASFHKDHLKLCLNHHYFVVQWSHKFHHLHHYSSQTLNVSTMRIFTCPTRATFVPAHQTKSESTASRLDATNKLTTNLRFMTSSLHISTCTTITTVTWKNSKMKHLNHSSLKPPSRFHYSTSIHA